MANLQVCWTTRSSQEAAATLMKLSFAGIPVRNVMLADFQSLREDDTLSRAVDLVLEGSQHDFPALDGNRVTGLLTRTDLIAALSRYGPELRVAEAMRRNVRNVDVSEPVEGVFVRMTEPGEYTIPVTQSGRLVGLLTSDNVAEFFLVHTALAESRQPKQSRAA